MGSFSFGYVSIGTVSVGIVSRVYVFVPLIQCNLSALKFLEKINYCLSCHNQYFFADLLIYSDHGTEAWRPRFHKTYLYRTTPKKPKQTLYKPRKTNSCSFLSFCCSHQKLHPTRKNSKIYVQPHPPLQLPCYRVTQQLVRAPQSPQASGTYDLPEAYLP